MLTVNGEIINQNFKEIYGKYLMESPFFTKIDVIESVRKGFQSFPIDTSSYTIQECCGEPTNSSITLKETYVTCVSSIKKFCKSDANVLDGASVRGGDTSLGTVGESILKEMALNFQLGLCELGIQGNTTLGINGLLSISNGTATGTLNNVFDACLSGFQAVPTNSLGKIGVFMSGQNYNKLKVEILQKNLPMFTVIQDTTDMNFTFPGLNIEIINMNGAIPNNRLIVTPFSNVLRFASRIEDDNFCNIAHDPYGSVIFTIQALFGITVKYPELSVIVNLT